MALAALIALAAAACGGGGQVVVSAPALVDEEGATDLAGAESGVGDAGDGAGAESDAEAGAGAPESDQAENGGFTLDFGSADAPSGADGGAAGEGSPSGVSLLSGAAYATETSGSYRYELSFSMRMSDGDFELDMSPDGPLATGAVADGAEHVVMDLGAMFEDLTDAAGGSAGLELAGLFGGDMRMETIVTGDTMYLYAPFFADWAEPLGGGQSGFGDLAKLGDGWGVIDLTAVSGLSAEDLSGLVGAQTGGSFDQTLELLRAAEADVTDLGAVTVRGVQTNHLLAVVNVGDMLVAQGMTAADLGAAGVDLSGVTIPFDVYVDADQRVRRVVMAMSMDTLRSAMPDIPIPASTEFEMTTAFDVFDFGAEITVSVPAADDIAVDLTEAMTSMASMGGF